MWKDPRRQFSHLLAQQEAFRWMSHQSLVHESGSKMNKCEQVKLNTLPLDLFYRSQHWEPCPLFCQSGFSSRFLALFIFKVSKGTVAFGCCDFPIGISRFGNPVTSASCSTRHWAHPGQQLQIHNGNSQNLVPPPPWKRNGKNQRMKRQT